MKTLVDALGYLAVMVAVIVTLFVVVMSIYLIKNARWEANLNRYKASAFGHVINPQGVELLDAVSLLEELKGIEERIAK